MSMYSDRSTRSGGVSSPALVSLILLLLVVATAGCYRYEPLETAPAPGMQVRATLSIEEALRRSELTGTAERRIEGRITAVDDDNLSLSAVTLAARTEFETRTFRRTFTIPRNEIESLVERRLSVIQTLVVVGGIGGIAFLLADQVLAGGNPEGDDGGGGDQATVVPIFRFGLRW